MSGKSHRSGQYGEEATGKIYYYDPDKLVLVGRDTPIDKTHPLWDKRVLNKPDEAMVLNIMAEGVHENVIIRFNGKREDGTPIAEVADGRQRGINAREANNRLRAAGKEPIFVPCSLKKGDVSALLGLMISTNEIRKEDALANKIDKLQRYLATGRTEEQAAITFGVTQQTIKNWLRLLELHPAVQKAVEDGVVPANIAKELSAVPQEEQPAALEKLIASGNIKGARAVEAAKNVRKGNGATTSKSRMLSKIVIADWKAALKKLEGKEADIAFAILSRILGNERALANYPKLRVALNPADDK